MIPQINANLPKLEESPYAEEDVVLVAHAHSFTHTHRDTDTQTEYAHAHF